MLRSRDVWSIGVTIWKLIKASLPKDVFDDNSLSNKHSDLLCEIAKSVLRALKSSSVDKFSQSPSEYEAANALSHIFMNRYKEEQRIRAVNSAGLHKQIESDPFKAHIAKEAIIMIYDKHVTPAVEALAYIFTTSDRYVYSNQHDKKKFDMIIAAMKRM